TLEFEFNPNPENEEERPAFVVDGQHRLFGVSDFESSGSPVPLLMTAILDADTTEQAFQFIVINNKASKVSPDLVKSILADLNEEALNSRLKKARILLSGKAMLVSLADDSTDSPFRGLVDWDRNRDSNDSRWLKPASLEGG